MQPLPLDILGAHEKDGEVTFGLWLPWVSAQDGYSLTAKVTHEHDQFLKEIPAHEFALHHSTRAPHGDFWSVKVPIAGTRRPVPRSAWGQPGRYLYRYCLHGGDSKAIDWITDPYAREFGVGKMSAFTVGEAPFAWSAAETDWRTPVLSDLVLYELNLAEFADDLEQAIEQLPYLRSLGVNAVEIMPVSNVTAVVDWGYLPVGYFGVDERFGRAADFQRFVDAAHRNGIAVVVDVVYGHTSGTFAYQYVYERLGYHENPFMGSFARDLFGHGTDFRRPLTQDFFLSASLHWLDTYHIDGFRYDCVPNYWDGAVGDGYANLVYHTWSQVHARATARQGYWRRFEGPGGELRLIQCAEQLEAPVQVLNESFSNCTWQNGTLGAARAVAHGDRGRLADLGLQLGLTGYPTEQSVDGTTMHKTALQYIESHDHPRFLCDFGTREIDEAQNELFREGDRDRWYKVQPFLIAQLLSKGIPMLWEGQEIGENYHLPGFGAGRVAMLRPMRWDYFYDDTGRRLLDLVSDLLWLRRSRAQLRRGEFFFFNHWDRYLSKGVLLFARYQESDYTLVAVNVGDEAQQVPFWFPIGGDYREELHGGALDLKGIAPYRETTLEIPSNYGRVWTSGAPPVIARPRQFEPPRPRPRHDRGWVPAEW